MRNRMLGASAAGLAGILVAAALVYQFGPWKSDEAASRHDVSQMGRMFAPDAIRIKRGETVTIVNDDGQLIHHAYVDSEKLKFDSGGQAPGSRTKINFPVTGTFNVLCAIHPKMKLTVDVE